MNAEKENTITMKFERLTKQNFNENSLDTFVRHQDVTECWRNVEGEWKLLPIKFVEEWDVEECAEIYNFSAFIFLASSQAIPNSFLPIFFPLYGSEISNSTNWTYCSLLPKKQVPIVMYPATVSSSNAA